MAERKKEMQTIFAGLSEKNKEIMILVAKRIKAAQEGTKQLCSQANPVQGRGPVSWG